MTSTHRIAAGQPIVTPAERTRKVRPVVKQRMRLAVYERDGYKCVTCGWAPPVPADYDGSMCLSGVDGTIRKDTGTPKYRQLELDHVVPFRHGGEFVLDNLQAMCHVCNARKGSKVQ